MKLPFAAGAFALGLGLGLGLVLAACSSEPPPAPAPLREEDKTLQRAIQEPLDKARAVEDQVLKAEQERAKQLEDSGG